MSHCHSFYAIFLARKVAGADSKYEATALSIMTLSVTKLSPAILSITTPSIITVKPEFCYAEYHSSQCVTFMLSVNSYCYAEYRNAQCRHAECR